MPDLATLIDALLPQTQCTKCGYPGCRPYAEAIARNEADINQCPPGGDEGVAKLAQLLGRGPKPLNPANGLYRPPAVAVIVEETCIGCARCLKACPVDAILGANKFMHTVIAELCTSCELCIPVCPVDCIVMESAVALPDPDLSRRRHEFHLMRVERDQRERDAALEASEVAATRNKG
jgi:electron transport complex protein RnfB